MPTVPLPEQPSLDQLRNQARELQRAIAAGDAAAPAHAAEHSPSGDASTLSRAQLVIARHYGFASWPRLRRHLRAVQRYSRAPHPAGQSGDRRAQHPRGGRRG